MSSLDTARAALIQGTSPAAGAVFLGMRNDGAGLAHKGDTKSYWQAWEAGVAARQKPARAGTGNRGAPHRFPE